MGCTQEEADQEPSGVVLLAWGGAAQAPRGAWFARGQHPMLFWVLPCQPWAMPDSALAKAPPDAWTAAQRKHAKRHMALGMSALRREPKRHVSKHGFFHSNISFLKFINDDNNIYTLINFNENNNIYNTNNIIYNTKYNNIL